jgi:hypothetical protein
MNYATTMPRLQGVGSRGAVSNRNRILQDSTNRAQPPPATEVKASIFKDLHTAMGELSNKMREIRPELEGPKNLLVGRETTESLASRNRKALLGEPMKAASSIRNAIREYAKLAVETIGPPVKIVEPVKLSRYQIEEAPDETSTQANLLDMLI